MKTLFKVAGWLLVIGGLVLGYEGFTDKDLVEVMVGTNSTLELIIDSAFGISAVIVVFGLITCKKKDK